MKEINCTIGEKEYLSMDEACAWLSVSKKMLYEWESKGMKVVKMSRSKSAKKLYRKKYIIEFLEKFEV